MSRSASARFALWLQYLFFLRFPILLGLALVALAPLALWVVESLLGNLFVLGFWGVLLVSWLATSMSWVVMITAKLIVRSAPERFPVAPLPVPGWLRRFGLGLSFLLAVPMLAALVARSPGSFGSSLGAVVGGVLLGFVGLVVAAAGQKLAAPPDEPAPDLLLSTDRGLLKRMPQRGRARTGSAGGPGSPSGYRSDRTGGMVPGHLLAGVFFALTLAVYLVGYFVFRPGVLPDHLQAPSLVHVLLILLLAGWGLPGVSFALDRFRVPVLLLLIAVSFLVGTLFRSDHFYRVEPVEEVDLLAPGAAFAAGDLRQGGDGPVVLVAASGGGITASLWTATVLTRLQEEVGVELTRSIRLLSSVSGGSVGALYFLDRFGADGVPPPDALAEIRRVAGASSLEGVSWGLAYPDLWRVFTPFLVRNPFFDRGWALEEIWRGRLERPDATLGEWRGRMAAGELPAAVFNSTIVETGGQLLLTPLDKKVAPQGASFLATYPGYDLSVATAARLSASFAWISPVSRPMAREEGGRDRALTPPWHGADGGYYDNFGIVSVVRWILSLPEATLEELEARGVVLVRIRAFPPADPDEEATGADSRGWVYSALGPLITLINVRTATQSFRDDVDVRLLTELAEEKGISVTLANFTLEAPSPLSWKLTDPERETIVGGWEEAGNRTALCRVRQAFGESVSCDDDEPDG